jgi:hypothetical protein
MSKAKTRATPSPQSRGGAGRDRDNAGRFVKGVSGNPGGTKHLPAEIKELARKLSLEGMEHVAAMMRRETTSDRDRLAAVRLMLEYGYGRPAAEFDRERVQMDRERLEMDKKRADLDSGEKSIKIVLSDDLRELAK